MVDRKQRSTIIVRIRLAAAPAPGRRWFVVSTLRQPAPRTATAGYDRHKSPCKLILTVFHAVTSRGNSASYAARARTTPRSRGREKQVVGCGRSRCFTAPRRDRKRLAVGLARRLRRQNRSPRPALSSDSPLAESPALSSRAPKPPPYIIHFPGRGKEEKEAQEEKEEEEERAREIA